MVEYGAVIDSMDLAISLRAQLAVISEKHRQYQTSEWLVYTPRHTPQDSLYGNLTFALKYEGINLLILKKLFNSVDKKLQYATSKGINSDRHRILNNLPGTINFCPLIFKTQKLENFINEDLSGKTTKIISGVHRDILLRTSAFLLLKDSKASFSIEGEVPIPLLWRPSIRAADK